MNPGYSAFSVARFFIEKARQEDDLTPMKLIKLTYIAHGWHLASIGEPLLYEPVQAWKYGPVVESIYHAFKDCGNADIPRVVAESFSALPSDVNEDTIKVLNVVWDKYSPLSGLELSSLTHLKGTPWDQVWNKNGGSSRRGAIIPNDLIQQFYRQKAETTPENGH